MPSWELLGDHDRWALAKYVKTLVRTYDEDEEKWLNLYELRGEPQPVDIGTAPPSSSASIARGKIAYRKGECWKCHGLEGKGDGASAAEQKDESGFPILPRDYSEGVFKGGSRPEDLFRRVSFGIGPMPAHEATLTVQERWDVVHYVLSLVKPEAQNMARQKRSAIMAPRLSGPLPQDPMDPAWNKIPETYLALMPLWWRKDRIEGVLVSAAHDGKEIAIRLSWVDPVENISSIRPEDFRDGAAVQFAKSKDAPFIAMGNDREKVNIWFWKADRQGAPDKFPDVAGAFPNRVVDDYPSLKGWKPGEGFAAQNAPAREHDPRFITGWGAGNVASDPNTATSVENLAASGFSTLATLGAAAQSVSGRGTWDKGVWRVILRRPFATKSPEEVELSPGKRLPIAFAVWDGAHNDRDGQKAITIWHDLEVAW